MLLKRLFLIVLCAIFIVPHVVSAQTEFINASAGQSTKISLLPQYPGPFQPVSVSVEDFSRDINNLTITWSINGKVVQKGIGMKSFSFTTGALGTASTITISIGGVANTVVVRPADIDLIWQSSSYVPPFYQGKALHSNQDPITITAEPFFLTSSGARLDPSTFVYTWSQNGRVAQESSGYGKRTFSVAPSVLSRSVDINVTVTTPNNTYSGTAATSIDETSPEVLVYENSPLYGLRTERAVNGSTFSLGNQSEATFVAVPFYFSAPGANKGVSYTWSQNNSTTDKTTNSIIFRAPEQGSGTAAVGVDVKSMTNFMQGASAAFSVGFDKK